MLYNYLKIAFRNFWKNKGYSIVNILGLSIGLAVCLLIFLFIRYELSFDNFHKDKDRIYRVVTNWQYADHIDYVEGTPIPLPSAMRQEFSGLENVAAIVQTGYQITVPAKENEPAKTFDERGKMFYVQPQFYEIFNFPWLVGNPETALKEPNTVALTRSVAVKFFGDWHKALGQIIILNNNTPLKITGIIKDLPNNTNFPFYVVISYTTFPAHNSTNWKRVWTGRQCYVKLRKQINIAQVRSRLPAFIKNHYKDNTISIGKTSFVFQPLKNIHFSEKYGAYGHQANSKELFALGIIGLFILVVACINFINMATAQAVNRSKEVGIRKVLGSRRFGLMLQFIGETMLITLAAMFIACVITELTLPWMSNLFDQPVSFDMMQYPTIILFLIAIVVATGFLAGVYPALVMSGFDPAMALKNKIRSSSNGSLRKSLVIMQFTVTLVIIIGMLIIMKQMSFFRNKPMGFEKHV